MVTNRNTFLLRLFVITDLLKETVTPD
jgi:hypothetical protein